MRPRTSLLDALSALSLLLAIAVGIVWGSRLLPRAIQIPSSFRVLNTRHQTVHVQGGFNYVYFERIVWADASAQPASSPAGAGRPRLDTDIRWLAIKRMTGETGVVSKGAFAGRYGRSTTVAMGFGYFVAIFLVLPALRIPAAARWWRAKSQGREGCCEQCGYDLRASPGRCPECGTPTTGETIWWGGGL